MQVAWRLRLPAITKPVPLFSKESIMKSTFIVGTGLVQCQPAVSGASVSVNGQAISVPNPIPLNYTIPLPSVSVVVQTPLGAISVPTSGTLTLNGVVADGTNTSNLNVAQLGEHLQVGGGVNVLGLGLVNVSVDATNSSSFNLQTAASVPVFSKVTF
jgi:hypothetical protein